MQRCNIETTSLHYLLNANDAVVQVMDAALFRLPAVERARLYAYGLAFLSNGAGGCAKSCSRSGSVQVNEVDATSLVLLAKVVGRIGCPPVPKAECTRACLQS